MNILTSFLFLPHRQNPAGGPGIPRMWSFRVDLRKGREERGVGLGRKMKDQAEIPP